MDPLELASARERVRFQRVCVISMWLAISVWAAIWIYVLHRIGAWEEILK